MRTRTLHESTLYFAFFIIVCWISFGHIKVGTIWFLPVHYVIWSDTRTGVVLFSSTWWHRAEVLACRRRRLRAKTLAYCYVTFVFHHLLFRGKLERVPVIFSDHILSYMVNLPPGVCKENKRKITLWLVPGCLWVHDNVLQSQRHSTIWSLNILPWRSLTPPRRPRLPLYTTSGPEEALSKRTLCNDRRTWILSPCYHLSQKISSTSS